jgi:hypothetical protein
VDDIDKFKEVVVESVLELCKVHYTCEQMASLLAQYPHRDLYKGVEERFNGGVVQRIPFAAHTAR